MTIQAAIGELSTLLGQRLTCSKAELAQHSTSETHFPPAPPDAVAYPETTEEVAALMRICAVHHCPVVGWGTGTSLEGQAQAFQGGVCVDFTRMNRVLEVSQADMHARVQPGVTREALNEELRSTGLFFPVDPGANASLGGMASTRASGTTAVRYGTMRDNVMGLEVVTATGEIIRTGTAARKTAAGYDLTALFVGSEGTLGLITELTLRLRGIPEAISSAVCAFDTAADAVNCVIDTIQMGVPMARIELVDAATVRAVNAYAGMNLPEKPHLLLEFHGSEAGVAEQAEVFGVIAVDHGGARFDWATKTEDRNALWAVRHNAFHAIMAMRPGARSLVTDICVPISRLAEAVETCRADLESAGIDGPILGHVGDGNFHAVLIFDPKDADEKQKVIDASNRLVDLALSLGGTVTGETRDRGRQAAIHGARTRPRLGADGPGESRARPRRDHEPGKMTPPRN